jgi:diguanylate cyclase (GGDEF)-like protein
MPTGESDRTSSVRPTVGGQAQRQAVLVVLAGPDLGAVHPLAPERSLLLGRREDADICLRDEGVSRRHATVQVRGDEVVLTDLGSANGTFVDGMRVREARLADGARVSIGGATVLKFAWTDELEVRWQLTLAQGAHEDPLTGLYNRRHFDERLGAELSAALRHAHPLTLLLVDVDHFKAVNDAHGHLAGDEALRACARVLRDAVRKEDVLARYGGEEFVVLARETAVAGARTLGERLRSAVERTPCGFQNLSLRLTVSVGAAVLSGVGDYLAGESERAVLDLADRALYLAKDAGRNRVVLLEGNTPNP